MRIKQLKELNNFRGFFVAMVLERIILVWTCIIPTHCTQTIPAPSAQHAAV